MNEHVAMPATARDALITELLSDVGRLHDDIKSIPKVLELSMRDSLNIVADAVEDAEDTALSLQKSTKDFIQAATAQAGMDVGIQLTQAIHQSLGRAFEPALTKAAVQIEQLETRVKSLSGSVRDTQATRFNYILLAGFVAVALTMIGAMGWLAIKAQDASETNKWFFDEYQAQRKAIDALPQSIRDRYKLQP